MKANEIMLGDWVIATNNGAVPLPSEVSDMLPRAGKVVGIDCDCVILEFVDFGFMLDRIEPISLTPEILEKNGFEKKAERFRHNEYELVLNPNTEDEHYLIVRLHPANENCDLMWAYIYYSPASRIDLNTIETKIVNCSVHELQHTLRLCGIDADIVI